MWLFRFLRSFRFLGSGIPTYEADNIVGEGTTVRGDLRGPGGFRIDGVVRGSIEAEGPIVIGEKGAVEGTIKARDVVVLGRMHGNVTAKAHLEVGPEGRVMGDVDVVSVKVHAGGVFHGASRIGDAGGEARLASDTRSMGLLPPSLTPNTSQAHQKEHHKEKGGRTLPPPLGAVPPPPPGAIGSQPKLPVVAPITHVGPIAHVAPIPPPAPPIPAPAVSTVERIGSRDARDARDSGEEAVAGHAPKAAAND